MMVENDKGSRDEQNSKGAMLTSTQTSTVPALTVVTETGSSSGKTSRQINTPPATNRLSLALKIIPRNKRKSEYNNSQICSLINFSMKTGLTVIINLTD